MRTILHLVQKDFALFLKDKTAIVLTFLVPFLLIYILGNVFSGSGNNNGLSSSIKLAAYDESGNPAAKAFLEALKQEDGITLVTDAPGPDASRVPFTRESVRQGIVERRYNFALIIPTDFLPEDSIGLRIQFLTNPKNQIESQIVNGLIQKALYTKLPNILSNQLDSYQREAMGDEQYTQFLDGIAQLVSSSYENLEYEELRPNVSFQGLSTLMAGTPQQSNESGNGFLQDLIQIQEDQVFGKEIKNPHLTRMVGGYAIMFLLFATTSSASALFEERNEGIFHRLLSMPIKRTHILWSKYIFNTLLGIAQALTLFTCSSFLFDVEVFSNFLPLLVASIFAAATCTAFGMLLASVSKTPQQAQGLGTLLILSMSALGGAWFPVTLMPELMQTLSKFTLVYWGIESFLGALWEESGIMAIIPELSILAAISFCLIAISTWRFKTGNLFR